MTVIVTMGRYPDRKREICGLALCGEPFIMRTGIQRKIVSRS